LSNQFRSLDDDEVEFLDSVLESSRAKEAEVRKENAEQLELFRKQREEAEKAAKLEEDAEAPVVTEKWGVGPRKRKKGKERDAIGGVKLRRTSTATKDKNEDASPAPSTAHEQAKTSLTDKPVMTGVTKQTSVSPARVPTKPSLGLAAYSSDEDD
jgi:hypothetical protein